MSLIKRNSAHNDEEIINEYLKAESANYNSKKKFTDLLCSLVNYFSLVPTLAYNTIWFFVFKRVLEKFGEALPHNIDTEIQGCSDIYNWLNYALSWNIICFSKALILLSCVKFCCGGENDCNMCCLLIKSLTSLIPSMMFVIKIPEIVSNYKTYTINLSSSINQTIQINCDNLANELNLFYRWEYAYILFLVSLFCLIPFGAVLMCLKEFWKSRGYNKEK